MGKLLALLVILGGVAAGAYYLMNQEDSGDEAPVVKKENKDGVRVEEKYGFTSNTP